MLGRGNPTLVFHFFKKFLATCTSSVPPSSCLGANKAASYPETRAKCRSPLAILLPHGSGYSLLLTPAVTFPVRAHDCRITAWHGVRRLPRRPFFSSTYRLLESLAPLFCTPFLCFQPVAASFGKIPGGWVPSATTQRPLCLFAPGTVLVSARGSTDLRLCKHVEKADSPFPPSYYPAAYFPRRRRSLSWTLSRIIFVVTCASLNATA